MADEKDGTHVIEPATDGAEATPAPVKRTINNHEVEVSPELATILDEQKAHYAEQQTKAQAMMADAKAKEEKVQKDLDTDLNFYENNWDNRDSYVPLVKGGDGYRGDPAMLGKTRVVDDTYDESETTSAKPMTPDPMVVKLAEIEKKQAALELRLERDAGQKTLGIMDSILLDPKYGFANRTEVLDGVKRYYNDTGRQPTKKDIIGYATSSHDTMKAQVTKAGSFTEKPRFEGPTPGGVQPREKVKGVPGNIFGTHAERKAAVEDLADRISDF